MSEGYKTDEEQIEDLKRWWNENGKSTLVGVALALATVFGWQGWQQNQQAKAEAASVVYQNLLEAVQATDATGELSTEKLATAKHLAGSIQKDFPNSAYAQFASLYKAQFAVNEKDYSTAEQELRWVLDNGDSAEIALQAQLRLARVLAAQEKYSDALALLNTDARGFASAYEEAKGDIYLQQGEKPQALLSYQKASELNQQGEQPVPNQILELKLQQLKSETGAADAVVSEEEA